MKVPSKLILDELDVIQKEFIWDSKQPKIKHSILIADYSEEGYKNVDIKSKLMSLKLIWIKRLLDDNFHTWKHLAKNFLIQLGDAYLFHSNPSLSDRCLCALNKLPTFYQELIILWKQICSTEPKNIAEILGQSLWNNKFIRRKDKPIFYRQFSDRGINTTSDLITEDRKFLRWSQARDKYQLPNKDVMRWLGLIESIPRDWKSVIKNDSSGFSRTYSISNDVRVLDKTIPLQAVTSRIAYTLLTKPLIEKPTAQKSISELLGTSDINWKGVYQLPHRVTNEASLHVFQYKILNNILYLNNRLHKFGFVESPFATENQKLSENSETMEISSTLAQKPYQFATSDS